MARRYGMTNEDGPMNPRRERNAMSNKIGPVGMIPNNGMNASPIKEDWSEPALLPRGVRELNADFYPNRHKSGRTTDLYEQVEKTMREDQRDFDSLTRPTNW